METVYLPTGKPRIFLLLLLFTLKVERVKKNVKNNTKETGKIFLKIFNNLASKQTQQQAI